MDRKHEPVVTTTSPGTSRNIFWNEQPQVTPAPRYLDPEIEAEVKDRENSRMFWQSLAQTAKNDVQWALENLPKNEPRAQYLMATYLQHGWAMIRQDIKYALDLYEKAAVQSHAGACLELSKLYSKGYSNIIPKNYDLAEKYAQMGSHAENSTRFNLETKTFTQAEAIRQCTLYIKVIEILRLTDSRNTNTNTTTLSM